MEGLFCYILWGVSNFKFLQKTGGYAISCPQFNRREQAPALQYGNHFAGLCKKVGEDIILPHNITIPQSPTEPAPFTHRGLLQGFYPKFLQKNGRIWNPLPTI